MGAHFTKETYSEGEAATKQAKSDGEKTIDENPSPDEREIRELTDEEKRLIKETWKEVETDVSKVGVVMFIRLFETHPDMKETFMPFKGIHIEEFKHSKQLREHALRVMGFIQKVVSRLDHPDKMESIIDENGVKHFHYGAVSKYVDYVGPQFLTAIQPSLSVSWSEETKAAWMSLFTFISIRMKKAMAEESKMPKTEPKTEPKTKESGSSD